jgi:uracil-DNA glycosylase
MLQDVNSLAGKSVSSLLQWWVEAGFDTPVSEEPTPWIGRTKQTKPVDTPEPAVDVAIPNTLNAFVEMLMTSTSLPVEGPLGHRVRPFGDAAAEFMIITDMPERGDHDAGQLMSGEVGALFDRMLTAIKLDRSQIYCTALCPARTASGQLSPQAEQELGKLALHHIHLVAPKRVWLLGQTTARAVFGPDNAQLAGQKRIINHEGSNMDCVASMHPRLLIQNPKLKAKVWEDMKILIGGQSQ